MSKDEVFLKETETLHSLRVLEEIEKNPQISQRELSKSLGVALGITNALLKTLARKGLVKIRGNNNRTLTYHLTHAGLLVKSRLAMAWTLNTVDFYREARQNVVNRLGALAAQGAKTVMLYGSGELAEIAAIVSTEAGLQVVGILAKHHPCTETIHGHTAMHLYQVADEQLDAVVICEELDEVDLNELRQHIDASTSLYRLF